MMLMVEMRVPGTSKRRALEYDVNGGNEGP